ncbi:response regulator transcription factor [Actinoallomurus vinaceus]|uniref:Response regulator transcription factor n=1 Tax=Actinoallomurus vinaceus TaxID=1080074 RepID=A0ABP8URG3_9ACTN
MTSDQVITVRGERELSARTAHLFTGVTSEFICAATDMDTWSHRDTRKAITARMRPQLTEGEVVVRKLYTPAALANEEQRDHLLAVAGMGARVRICATGLPHETIIIDRRVMILAGTVMAGDREFTVTTSPTLISGVLSLVEATWEAATEITAYLHRDAPQVDAEGRRILQALGDGLTDEVAARRLGLSLRTYRRRVAELMRLLGSESRFQAGVHAGEFGLIP